MTAWQTSLRHALDALAAPVRVFFRDDDGGWDDARLVALLDLFAAHTLPLDVAVIPSVLSEATAAVLVRRMTAPGARLSVHTHGFAHVNHAPAGKKCEFGPDRRPGDVAGELVGGRARMTALFGPLAAPVFTPPWNRCSVETARGLRVVGYRALSRDRGETPFGLAGLTEIPVAVDWQRRDAAGLDGVVERFATSLGTPEPVGVMLHHAVMDDAAREQLGTFLRLLATHPQVVCTDLRSLMEDTSGAARAAG